MLKALLMVAILGLFGINIANAKTYILITIDHCKTYSDHATLRRKDVNFGINGLIDICEKHKVVPTFFFSPYDFVESGEENVKSAAQLIVNRGADLQLHTHPHHYFDKKRNNMFQYNLKEQTQIVALGIAKLKEWTGIRAVAHRAGGYSANSDTIIALKENGILLDSSYFFKEHRSRIAKNEDLHNKVFKIQNVIEIPVSIFTITEYPSIFGGFLEPFERIRKIDIDWSDYDHLSEAMVSLIGNQVPAITLFLHTHSLMTPAKEANIEKVFPDYKDIEEFDEIIKFLKSNTENEIVSVKEFVDMATASPTSIDYDRADHLPIIRDQVSIFIYLRRLLSLHRNKFIYSIPMIFVIVFISKFLFSYKAKGKQS